ncbi:ABC transporter ATP-binding protein [Fundicoccus culcitae]|uniref:ABC transporter ATP-binding protein/permease n=1 Tax=Fundicoccus culcitae TaxID=2969821 RepID=A0ABY5P5V2_9LACT|nr:ABC transporter ATP-binding protein [Fundicoccus culcitae]UUX33860.1 ABC transporter ATP-binding protein/permease [Fundicoccus culcitae]
MKRLLKYFNGYKLPSFLGPIFKLIEALLELLVPSVVAIVIDEAIPSGDQRNVIQYIVFMFAIAFIGLLFSISAQYFSAKAAIGFTENLNHDLFEKIMYLSKESVDEISTASLVTRNTSDTYQIQTGLNTFFRLFLRSPFIVAGSLVMAMRIDLRMTGYFLGMIIVLFLIIALITYLSAPLYTKARKTLDRLVTIATEQIQGVRVIRAFRQDEREFNQYKEVNNQLTDDQIKVGFISVLTNPLTYLVVNVTLILVIWQGGNFIFAGTLSQGQLVALVNYLLAILVELVKLTMVVMVLNRSYVSAQRVVEVLEIADEEQSFDNIKPEKTALNDLTQIVFEDVQFTYPKGRRPVLDGLSFSINQGDLIGIIGGTGAGKSAIIQLLTKTYDASDGIIWFNENSLDTRSRNQLRNEISIVPQKANLFKGTIRSNLLVGNPEASDEELWQALDVAQATSFVKEKAGGLDAVVEAFGRNFSGGQKQRLTIARALLKPASILIFDDSTSALDFLTENQFRSALKQHYAHLTILMISQRTRSIENADNILVLDAGKQLGFGKHEELLQTVEVYQEIHSSQQVKEVTNHG